MTTTTRASYAAVVGEPVLAEDVEQNGPLAELFRNLRTAPTGLADREAVRRLVVYGPNELTRRGGRRWPRELLSERDDGVL